MTRTGQSTCVRCRGASCPDGTGEIADVFQRYSAPFFLPAAGEVGDSTRRDQAAQGVERVMGFATGNK